MSDTPSDALIAQSGARWLGLSQLLTQILRIVVYVLLARLLKPEDFGLLAMAVVVTSFLEIFRDFGTRTAIVQRKSVDQKFLSSLFIFNLCLGIFLTLATVTGAPLAALAFDNPDVIDVLRWVSLSILIASIGLTYQGMLYRQLRFRALSLIQVVSALSHALVSIGLAAMGFGVWALVAGILASTLATTTTSAVLSDYRPHLYYSSGDIRSVLNFSANLSASQLFGFLIHNADKFVIGRLLGAAPLGFYNLAQRMVSHPVVAFGQVTHNVLFPSLARRQDNNPALRRAVLRSVCALGAVTFPAMLGLSSVAETFVVVVLGPEWSPAIIVIAILAPTWAALTISDTVLLVYKAKGRTDLLLIWTIVSGSMTVCAYLIGVRWGLPGVAIAYGCAALLIVPLSLVYPLRMIEMSFRAFLRPMIPFVVCSIFMYLFVTLTQLLAAGVALSPVAVLSISVPIGVVAYAIPMLVWRPPVVADILRTAGFKR